MLGNELQRLRLEVFRSELSSRSYQLRLWRSTVVRALVGADVEAARAEVGEWETLEDFGDLFDAEDAEFEADSLEQAEQRALAAIRARLSEAAWAKQ